MSDTDKIAELKAYYIQKARKMLAAFKPDVPFPPEATNSREFYDFLLRQALELKKIHAGLQLPWEDNIPMFVKSFLLYTRCNEPKSTFPKAIHNIVKFMSIAVLLMKSSRLNVKMIEYYNNEINDLKLILDTFGNTDPAADPDKDSDFDPESAIGHEFSIGPGLIPASATAPSTTND